jgi:hypothetical protein
MQRAELATRANDHELDTGSGTPWEDKRQPQTTSQPLETENKNHELNASLAVAELLPKQAFSRPFDPMSLESNTESSHAPASSLAPFHSLLSDATTTVAASSSRIDELRAKRDRIRVEKERLLKLQELDEMEAVVQREILEEQNKASGNVSP